MSISNLPAQLRALREAAGLSQVALAKAMDMTSSAVSQIERGAIAPTVRTIEAWAKACGSAASVVFRPATDEATTVAEIIGGLSPNGSDAVHQVALLLAALPPSAQDAVAGKLWDFVDALRESHAADLASVSVEEFVARLVDVVGSVVTLRAIAPRGGKPDDRLREHLQLGDELLGRAPVPVDPLWRPLLVASWWELTHERTPESLLAALRERPSSEIHAHARRADRPC